MCVNIQLPPAQLNQSMEPWACVPEVLGHLLFPSREAAGSGRLTTPHTASQLLGIICHCTSCSEGPASLCNHGDHQFFPSLLQFCPFPAIGVGEVRTCTILSSGFIFGGWVPALPHAGGCAHTGVLMTDGSL